MFEHMHNLYKNIHRLKKNLQNGFAISTFIFNFGN